MEDKIPDNLTVQQLRKMIVKVFKETQSLKEQLRILVPKPLKVGKYLNRIEAAKFLEVSKATITTWANEGKLEWYKYGIYRIYNYEDVMELARQRNFTRVSKRKSKSFSYY